MDALAVGPARWDYLGLAADVISTAPPGSAGAALTLCIHFGSCPKSATAAQAAGHREVLYGMVAFSVMLTSAMGYIGPRRDILGQLDSWERIALA